MSHPHLSRLRRGAAGVTALAGILSMLGWGAGVPALAQLVPGQPPMPLPSAILLTVAAASLAADGTLATVLAGALLLSGLGLTFGALAGVDGPTPALTQPATYGTIIAGAAALLLRGSRSPWSAWATQILALLCTLAAARALFGFIPHPSNTLLAAHFVGLSLQGSLGILLLGLGLLVARPAEGFMALALSERPAGRLIRWLAAAGVVGPIGAILLSAAGWQAGLFGAALGVVLVIIGNLLVFYGVAAVYDRADQGRRAAEERLAVANAALEQRVAERTAALAEREAQISAIGDNLPGVMIYQRAADRSAAPSFTYVSAGVMRVSGLTAEAVLARPELLYAQLEPEDRARLERAERTSAHERSALDIEVRKHTPWGLRWSRIRARPRLLDGRLLVWDGIEVDITAQKEVEAAIERDRRYQAALFACSHVLLRAVEPPDERMAALGEALRHLLVGAQADRAFLMRMVEPGDAEPYVELQAEICAPATRPALMSPSPLRLPLAILAPLVNDQTPPSVPIAGTLDELAARAPAFAELIAGLGVRSLAVLPLRLGDGAWGAIGFHDCSRPRVWDEQELLLLRTAAELIGGALQRWEDEDELRRREALLTTLFDLLPMGVAIIDAEARPVRLNRAIAQIAGLDLEALAAGAYRQMRYIHPDGRPMLPAEYASQRAMAGEVVRDLETGLIRPDGQLRWLSSNAAPLPFPGMAAALVVVDITERKRVEEERLSFERKLLEAQRLESLGVLAGGVAHDFNNILAAILGHAELARLDVDRSSEAAASLDAIVLGARRAADLTGQMLAYAGRGSFKSEAVSLNLVTRELSELTRATMPQGVTVRQELDPELPPVIGDGTQMRQVLLNLLTNGAEAIMAAHNERRSPGRPTGTLTVRTGRDALSEARLAEATVSAATPGVFGFLEVSDTGCGIDGATLARIFDPFFTTKFSGRGLGLAAVQGIVRAHRGALFVSSAPGRGATFRACFPLAPPDRGPGAQAPLQAEGGPAGPGPQG